MNIEQKNTLFVVSLILIVVVSITGIAFFLLRDHIRHEVEEELEHAYRYSAQQLEHDRGTQIKATQYLVNQPQFQLQWQSRDRKNLVDFMRSARQSFGLDLLAVIGQREFGESVRIGDAERALLSSRRGLQLEDVDRLAQHALEKQAPAKGYLVMFDELINAVAVPFRDRNGRYAGVLIGGKQIGDRDLVGMSKLLDANISLYQPDSFMIHTLPEYSYQVETLIDTRNLNSMQRISINDVSFFVRVYPLSDAIHDQAAVYMLVSVPAGREYQDYIEMFKHALYAGLIVMLLSALFGIQVSRSRLAKPISNLASVSHSIGEGNLQTDIPHMDRDDELGDLAHSFDQMRQNIILSQKQEQQLRERMSAFAEVSSDWLWETDAQGLLTYLSSSVHESLGYSVESLLGKRMADLFSNEGPDSLKSYLAGQQQDEVHRGFKDVECWFTSRQGFRTCLRFNGMPHFEDGMFMGYRGTASDITKSKNDEERLIRLTNKDYLTGLSNRARFMEDLAREISISKRQATCGAILMIDIDHFKLVNDTAGHSAGDEVIVQVAGLLRRHIRSVDLVARLSGDEFAIAYINTDEGMVGQRAEQIVNEINQLKPMYGGRMINISASIGIVIFPEHGDSAVELMAKADAAMYEAKAEGRNRAHHYHPDDLRQHVLGSQLQWKDRIHNALENDRLVLAFQPIRPAAGEQSARYEVLVRMKKSNGEFYHPGDFIPTAEQLGLIRDIDNWVVSKAIGVLANLPPTHSHISFTVNLSGLSVGEPAMLELIRSELDKTGLDHSRLTFEVTESAAFQDLTRAIDFIEKIKELGCRIALDDFGVGFSSFSYLKQLDADVLKIDGSFIREIHLNKDDQLFVKALVDVARGMGIITVAEFVESEAVFEMVRRLGVDYVQGYYIGRPVVNLFE